LDSFKGMAKEHEIVDLLCDLVSINSVNATLQGGVGEAALGEFVMQYLSGLGCRVDTQEVVPGQFNVFGSLPHASDSQPLLLLEAHMDTVTLEPMSEALKPRLANGRLYGRGACDTKGSLAGMLYAFKLLSEKQAALSCRPLLMAAVDEEVSQGGIGVYAQTRPNLAGAVVGEPTNLTPVIVHKGCIRWRVRSVGRAAHSSRPNEGNNAIYQMVDFIKEFRSDIESRLADKAHPLAGPPTVSIGVIHGGIQVNIVPDSCYVEIDCRTVPGEKAEAILTEVDDLIRRIQSDNPQYRIVREEPSVVLPYLDTPSNSRIARCAQAACISVMGTGEFGAVAYGSDASKIAAMAGVPAVVLGPGSIAQAHTADEWVPVKEVVRSAELYAEMCRLFGQC